MIVYFDMDGVIADFEQGIVDLYGRPFDDLDRHEVSKFWFEDAVRRDFFSNLKPMSAGIELLNALVASQVPVSFLTSTGVSSRHYMYAAQKLDFLRRHLSRAVPVAFVYSGVSKAMFASKDAVLIDDHHKNITAFNAAGGIGLLYKPELAASILDYVLRLFSEGIEAVVAQDGEKQS